ncbi:MAG: DUF4339 domain-containing protein [Planctomycetaceae bacterium]|nr:DUF4339 domain-containing protein [Planctomycetaceae bacterium]
MDSCWYYYLFGEQFGPVTRQQLIELADDGTLSATDRVRHASGEVLQEVQSVLGIDRRERTPARSTAPVASPLTMMADSSGTVGQNDLGPSIDDFVIEKTSDDSRISPALSPPSQSPLRSSTPMQREPATEEAFYLRSSETTIGPLTLDALCRMADAGKVASADYIRRASESGWHPASEVPEVMAAVLMQEASRPTKRNRSRDSDVRRRSNSGPGGSGVRPRKGGNGKKKPRTRDEKLQGIFDEVFQQEKASSEKRVAPSPSVASRAATEASTAPDPSTISQTPSPADLTANADMASDSATMAAMSEAALGGSPGLNSPGMGGQSIGAEMPSAASSGLYRGGAAGAMGTQPPVKPWTPPKKKKSGGGMDPDLLRKLGIGAGVVVALLLIPVIWSILPGSRSAPDSGTVKPALMAMVGRYEAAAASPDSWKAFQEQVRPQAGAWVKQYRAVGQRTPEQLKLQEAATQLVQLVNSKHDDKQKHEQFLEKINEQLGGVAG